MNGGSSGGDGLYHEGAPASRLRRRCRSEGLERSPYDCLHLTKLYSTDGSSHCYQSRSPSKPHSQSLQVQEHSIQISVFPSLDDVEFLNAPPINNMASQRRSFRSPSRSPPKFHIEIPNRATRGDDRLPRVEEFLEKLDPELMDYTMEPVAKQPLKSILNNPRKSPPPGILKKKSKLESKLVEGRRRQRALSESEYNCVNYESSKSFYDSHLHATVANMKRMKDNSGTVHYGNPYDNTHHLSPKPNPLYFLNSYDYQKRPENLKMHNYGLRTSPKRDEIVNTACDYVHKRQGSPKRDPGLNYPIPTSPAYDSYNKIHDSPKDYVHKQGCPRAIVNLSNVRNHKRHESPEKPIGKVSFGTEYSPHFKVQLSPKDNGKLQYGNATDNGYRSHESAPKVNGDVRPMEPNILRTTAIGVRVPEIATAVTQPSLAIPAPPSPSRGDSPLPTDAISRSSLKKVVRKARKASKLKLKPMKSKHSATADVDVDNGSARSPDLSPPSSPTPRVPSPTIMETDTRSAKTAQSKTDTVHKSRQTSEKLSNGTIGIGERYISHSEVVIATLQTTHPFRVPKKDSSITIPESLSTVVRASLFPLVPPYLRFVGHDDAPSLKPPLALGKHLKWKLTSITPIVVKKTLLNSGFKLVKSDCDTSECPQDETVDWIGIWGKHMKSIMFRAIKDGQKMNHFPGTFQIGRKDRLWRNLQRLAARHGIKEFGIMPKTYVLPHDMKLLKRDWEKYAARNEKWIIKPPASARGTGIAVVSRWAEIPKKRSVVVQRYISKPLLINGSKFDLRLYVLVTSVHPLRIFLFNDGLARFASAKYTDEVSSLHDRYMHLTNYSINRLSKNYAANEDASACQGHKWTLQTLFQYLERERSVNTIALWERLKDLVIKTILCGESSIRALTETNITSQYNCYELFGVDVLLDEELKPWLLEVNISPSLHSSSPLDVYVKGPLVSSVLNIAQFHVPNKTHSDSSLNTNKNGYKYASVAYDNRLYTVYLSKEERDKHIIYTKMEGREEYLTDILSTLTPDDVRHLVRAEDELAAGAATAAAAGEGPHMERIFPTPYTHKYLEFLASPRYYNRLLDAWECKYRHDRSAGIHLLRSLCEMGYHLEVPPVPLKRAAAPELACLVDACRMTRKTYRKPALITRRCHWRWSQRKTPGALGARSAIAASLYRRTHDAGA